ADQLTVGEAYRRATVVDRNAPAVARDQNRVIGQPDDAAGLEHLGDRVLHGRPGVFVDDPKDLLERLIFRRFARPTGQPLGHGVEENYTAGDVGDYDGIANALQRDFEGFPFPT